MALVQKFICTGLRGLSYAVLGLVCGLSSAALASTTLTVQLGSTNVDKGQPVTGTVAINTTTPTGQFDLTVELFDNEGRIADRTKTRVTLPVSSVPFSLNSQHMLTMNAMVLATGKHVGGVSATPNNKTLLITPEPFDYEDYWCNVWGDGANNNSLYWNALKQANVNLGHIYRNASYFGAPYNIRPNNDFIEDKVWFEMTDTMHSPNYNGYNTSLGANTYWQPANRQYLVRPTSLNDITSLTNLENTIRPRMQASRKYRPMQWNISDEYGLGRRASPFDYDIGPAAMNAFAGWLQARYGTIAALNSVWGTTFASFDDVKNVINAPQGGQAAWIITQEIRDRQFPLASSTTSAKNFAPWGDFRTFMDETFVAAMKRCVDVGRSIDPAIRVGFEGAEPATPLTGYDYARQLHEIGSIEAYDIANSPEYIRSMRFDRYGQKIMSFITLFNSSNAQYHKYTLWYRLLHYGVTGAPIWWNADFFGTNYALTSYATGVAPTFGEFQNGLVKLLSQGDWDDSEVALLYSQKSIQINYMVDSEADGKTWIRRFNSTEAIYNSMFYTHVGWCKALEDIGLKGRFISYDEVANGVLATRGVKVLVLPRALALSEAEKAAIEGWVNAGGVVIADSMCGYYDEYLRRRSIAGGGGWWDSFLGISRTNYATVDLRGSVGSAFAGSPVFQTAPAGFEGLTGGLVANGLYAVENGVRAAAGSTALIWFNNNSAQPALIVRNHGAGKVVYMNLSLHRYGNSNSGVFTSERYNPSSASAGNVRQLVKNLVALGGVTPKVAVKQNHDNPTGADVYNLEKSMRVDGAIRYLTCVINSYQDVTLDDWGLRSDAAAVLFGQSGATNANMTLALASAAHVYDVRKQQYLGHGTSINATMPVYEGGVFALLPYQVNSLSINSVRYDYLNRTTVTVKVNPSVAPAGNHVLRLEVFNPSGLMFSSMTRKVVAKDGTWTGVVPFGASDTVHGSKIRFTDVATGVVVEKTLVKYAGDINGDGKVNVFDLQLLGAAWNTQLGAANYSPAADLNNDNAINVFDLQLMGANWNKS